MTEQNPSNQLTFSFKPRKEDLEEELNKIIRGYAARILYICASGESLVREIAEIQDKDHQQKVLDLLTRIKLLNRIGNGRYSNGNLSAKECEFYSLVFSCSNSESFKKSIELKKKYDFPMHYADSMRVLAMHGLAVKEGLEFKLVEDSILKEKLALLRAI